MCYTTKLCFPFSKSTISKFRVTVWRVCHVRLAQRKATWHCFLVTVVERIEGRRNAAGVGYYRITHGVSCDYVSSETTDDKSNQPRVQPVESFQSRPAFIQQQLTADRNTPSSVRICQRGPNKIPQSLRPAVGEDPSQDNIVLHLRLEI